MGYLLSVGIKVLLTKDNRRESGEGRLSKTLEEAVYRGYRAALCTVRTASRVPDHGAMDEVTPHLYADPYTLSV